MTAGQIALFLCAGVLGGAVNAAAGGAKLFVFPMLLAAGLPPVAANATATLAVWPAQMPAAWVYRDRLRGELRALAWQGAPAVIGSLAGVAALLAGGDAGFLAFVPACLTLAVLAIAFGEPIARRIRPGAARAAAPALMLLTGFYGGYFGAGMAFLIIASLTLAGVADAQDANARKNLFGVAINSAAVPVLALSGLVDWGAAATVALGGLLGGWLGARLARRVPQRALRWGVAGAGAVLTASFLLR